jgi:hypothetical protein
MVIETARHHAIEHGQESVDLFLRVDDLDHDRQILRKTQDLCGVNTARMAESDMAAQDGCAASWSGRLPNWSLSPIKIRSSTASFGICMFRFLAID